MQCRSPTLFTLTTWSPRVESSINDTASASATLTCELNSLDHEESYSGGGSFKNETFKENGKYKIFYKREPPDFCQQSKGSVSLILQTFPKKIWTIPMCAAVV
ncbi:hypothetical protein OS493_036642 [Desmophyllum pertusum]|uniref:Uncharacterized protein n=1 Tax=Desmophyllum pertusum TaxID=174260 RepID=A0A9X0CNE7_9CNID|nr:hypothetical protein OS493_036642 [Desmophyllum pertusum]